jgi:hypothetical protein
MRRSTWRTRHFSVRSSSVGGLRYNVNERLMVRPGIRALTVFADGDTHTMEVCGVNVGYRF